MQVIVIECDAIVCVDGLNRKWESQLTSSLINTIICNSLRLRKTEKLSLIVILIGLGELNFAAHIAVKLAIRLKSFFFFFFF